MPERRTARAAVHERAGLRGALLAGAVALYVSRPLVPSESVAWRGDGLAWVMGWLLIALGAAWGAASGRLVPQRWTAPEWAAVFLASWHAVSAIRVVWTGDGAPRPALNMLWEQLALVVGFLVVRQLTLTPLERRAVVMAMFALTTALAAHGWHQYLLTLPATRAEYAQDPDKALQAAGQWSPPGSAERSRFEQRLASTEPMASFALANSLAGVLACWCVVGVGGWMDRLGSRWQQAIFLTGWLAVVACLLATKSRSAVVGATCGGAWIVLACLRLGEIPWRKLAVGVTAGIALLSSLFFTGTLDREVLSEAPKSLGYRWEYWQASARMIAARPWLGCGPGNFGDHYTLYKLPQSSEEIADPHNAVVELAATAGWPAAAGLLLVSIGCGISGLRGAQPGVRDQHPGGTVEETGGTRWVIWGTVGGVLLAITLGLSVGYTPSLEVLIGQVLVGAAVLYALMPWVTAGTLPAQQLLAGAVTLVVNLLAAGGIGFPGVAGSLWLLLALVLTTAQEQRSVPRQADRRVAITGVAVVLLLLVSCWVTAYRPVFAARAHLERAQHAAQTTGEELRAAAAADPWASEPWRRLAQWEFQRWRQQGTAQSASDELWQRMESAEEAAQRMRPHSSSLWLECAERHHLAAQTTGDATRRREAVTHFREAVARYPSSAVRRGRLAEALAAAGESASARTEAAEALELSEQTPHADQKLSDEQCERLVRITQAGAR